MDCSTRQPRRGSTGRSGVGGSAGWSRGRLVNLKPTRGGEIRKTRPCVLVSPDELNTHLRTFIVAPLTTGGYSYPFRVACTFQGKSGHVVLDQIRTVDQERLVKRLGRLSLPVLGQALAVLREMFAA